MVPLLLFNFQNYLRAINNKFDKRRNQDLDKIIMFLKMFNVFNRILVKLFLTTCSPCIEKIIEVAEFNCTIRMRNSLLNFSPAF